MFDFSPLYEKMHLPRLQGWADILPAQIKQQLDNKRHGDLDKWQAVLDQLPAVTPSSYDLNTSTVRIGEQGDLGGIDNNDFIALLKKFHPWRKGPFDIFGIHIDTEWRSDWKWERVSPHISDLTGRTILDVGCGSGYHCWRMRGAGAELVIGIDPTLVFNMQYQAMARYLPDEPVYVLPVGIDDVPSDLRAFDTVFSMGILYHRRSPIDHLYELRECLVKGGELVLETLVIDGAGGEVLMPEDRYAQMRNVWFIPTVPTLEQWLRRCGYQNIRTVDVNVTSLDEQRATDWMHFQSLNDFLDPSDQNKTIEGYPAPRRATLIATAP
ncbi:MAG: tRNA 5-methoxyuridine(34)/uridine 5-oxyacetic acid(34) synthase CmoB [Gammaproteobacteria bacterium]|nr:tRNA 5-methoxyuridine(34)/uridine 5-oxyacetic acid(34) synthase CmoB [Gammaproteobacteria bacterium]MDH5653976.1 tRNA 5-methoxyuridine(34)/uridine 5-oxyacetic acid(34) synthase CmoB [Gammaproteobacteria bacterium]